LDGNLRAYHLEIIKGGAFYRKMLTVTTGILHRKVAKLEAQDHDAANVPALPLYFATVGPSYRNLPAAPALQRQAVNPAAVALSALDRLLFSVRVPLADLFLSLAVLLSTAVSLSMALSTPH
jgi:hypothetical protein